MKKVTSKRSYGMSTVAMYLFMGALYFGLLVMVAMFLVVGYAVIEGA